MTTLAAAGAGFLIAVLWFDLMFDVQTRGHAGNVMPNADLTSIASYYRRVTTEANPMGRVVGGVMLLLLLVLGAEVLKLDWWIAWPSLVAAMSAIALSVVRTVRNAIRLGSSADQPEVQTRLARAIYGDHLFCLAAMVLVVVLQIAAPWVADR